MNQKEILASNIYIYLIQKTKNKKKKVLKKRNKTSTPHGSAMSNVYVVIMKYILHSDLKIMAYLS